MEWYKIKDEMQVDTPALLVYPKRIQANISELKRLIKDPLLLRPHVKTHKTKEIAIMQMEAGIRKFKCATIAEADMLGDCGAPDVLLAYPLYGPKQDRFIELIHRYPNTQYSALVDNIVGAESLSAKAVANNLRIAIYIDLNIGMGRTGIVPGKECLALFRQCAKNEGFSVKGFHAYDGHVREVDLNKRKIICNENYIPVSTMLQQLDDEGFSNVQVVIGGSPSFPIYAQYADVECSPGTFVLWDKGYSDTLPEQKFLPAAVLMTRVVSLPDSGHICVDLGYKAIACENPLLNRVHFLNAPIIQPTGHSEEHMVLDAGIGHGFKLGDVLYALPIHICPTVAMYDKLQVVEDGCVTQQWEVVARGR